MIQVQIASRLSPLGVEGVRWVLVDPSDAASLAASTPAAVLAAAHTSPGDPADEGSLLSMALLKLLVTGLGLGAALWAAQGWLGEPSAAALAPLFGNPPKPVTPAAALPGAPALMPVPAQSSTPVTTPDPMLESAPAETMPMPNPLLTAPQVASPVTALDAAQDATAWVALPLPLATAATAPVLGPLLTAELR